MSEYVSDSRQAVTPAPSCLDGWELLLGPLTSQTVICMDGGGSSVVALSQRCRQVCVLVGDAQTATETRSRFAALGLLNVGVVAADAEHGLAHAERYEGLVVSDLSGEGQRRFPGGLARFLELARPMLAENAFVVLVMENRWGIRSGRSLRKSPQVWSSHALVRTLRAMGASAPVVHPVVMDEGARIVEVLPSTGYRATKNASLPRERIKQWLWGARGANWFAPGLAAVAWLGDRQGRSLIDELTPRMVGPQGRWSQYLVLLSGKLIVTFTSTLNDVPRRVAVVTRDPRAILRRTEEARCLNRLASSLPPALAALLPRVIDQFSIDQNACFVLQHISGVTADAVVPGLDEVTRGALRFALDLHQATSAFVPMDAPRWAHGLGYIFESAVRRNPAVAEELRDLERCLLERLMGQPWLQVCSHGDFKIENVMYDPVTYRLTGVIDWEHAMLDGLPYIDVAYLLAYNRMLRGQSWLQAAAELLGGRMGAEEQALEDAYWRAVRAGPRLTQALRALVVVHHIGMRWHGDWAEQATGELKALIRACTEQAAGSVENLQQAVGATTAVPVTH